MPMQMLFGHISGEMVTVIAFLVTVVAAHVLAVRAHLDTLVVFWGGVLGIAGALGGGQLWTQLFSPMSTFVSFPQSVLDSERSVIGAAIGAAVFSCAHLRIRRQPVIQYVETLLPAVFIGYSIARVACLIDGHCFGASTGVFWAVQFLPGMPVFSSQVAAGLIVPTAVMALPVHPTQMYHLLLGVFSVLVLLRTKEATPGTRLAMALLIYGAGRFVIQFFRGDAVPIWGPLDVNHIAALVMLAVGMLLWRLRPTLAAAREQPA